MNDGEVDDTQFPDRNAALELVFQIDPGSNAPLIGSALGEKTEAYLKLNC